MCSVNWALNSVRELNSARNFSGIARAAGSVRKCATVIGAIEAVNSSMVSTSFVYPGVQMSQVRLLQSAFSRSASMLMVTSRPPARLGAGVCTASLLGLDFLGVLAVFGAALALGFTAFMRRLGTTSLAFTVRRAALPVRVAAAFLALTLRSRVAAPFLATAVRRRVAAAFFAIVLRRSRSVLIDLLGGVDIVGLASLSYASR